jgi:ubiquinone/menaquinone biosynthesis C-methylase UbiE
MMTNNKDAREQAYLYDLFIVPAWREVFDEMVDEEVEMPQQGRVLDAQCGTGGFAVALAARLGPDAEVIGIDDSPEKLELARGKAEMQKVTRVSFHHGTLENLEHAPADFDLVIADASMHPHGRLKSVFAELLRIARPGATVVIKLTTHGSFDEFFSIYWEALHDAGLDALTPQLEALITERLTIAEVEELASQAGLRHIRSVTRKERFDYADAKTFLDAPLIENFFLEDWLAMLPGEAATRRVRQNLTRIIDEERHHMDFDVSIKATLVIGQK